MIKTSRIFQSRCNLSLHAQFHVSSSEINHINLSLKPENESLSWEIIGPAELDDQIDNWMRLYADKKVSPKNSLPLVLKNFPPYMNQVLAALRSIPFGKTLSYKDLAILTNRPNAARAVGNACGRNPFILVIPCHRVLASGLKLGGFSAGLEIKKRLLAFEG